MMMNTTINGHNLYIEQDGPQYGPEVVLLHHGLGSARVWRRQIPVLADCGFHVTAYDRWGYGGSDGRAKLDLPEFKTDINDLHSLLQKLRIGSATLVGHSDGGTIALYYAAEHLDMVSSLVVIAAHIYVEPNMESGIEAVKNSFYSDKRFRNGLYRAHGSKYESVFANWFDGWHCDELLNWDMRPVLRQIHCPALIIQGEADEHATPKHATDIAEAIPGAELWIVPGLDHMQVIEKTEVFNPRLLEFLQKNAYGVKLP
jgi:pimeloyl-ACP methyl ester carboxylesterase